MFYFMLVENGLGAFDISRATSKTLCSKSKDLSLVFSKNLKTREKRGSDWNSKGSKSDFN